MMAVIAGLNNAAISRLKQTFKDVSMKDLKKKEEYELLLSPESSYRNYRAKLHAIQPPCIPYLGTYLADLTFIEEGNKDIVEGKINFSKQEFVSKIINEVINFQQVQYRISPSVSFIDLRLYEGTSDKDLWELSKRLE